MLKVKRTLFKQCDTGIACLIAATLIFRLWCPTSQKWVPAGTREEDWISTPWHPKSPPSHATSPLSGWHSTHGGSHSVVVGGTLSLQEIEKLERATSTMAVIPHEPSEWLLGNNWYWDILYWPLTYYYTLPSHSWILLLTDIFTLGVAVRCFQWCSGTFSPKYAVLYYPDYWPPSWAYVVKVNFLFYLCQIFYAEKLYES